MHLYYAVRCWDNVPPLPNIESIYCILSTANVHHATQSHNRQYACSEHGLLCLPSHREVGTCCFTLVRSVRPFSLCLCVPSYRAYGQNTGRWPKAGLMLAHVRDAAPASNQHWFNASCLMGLSLSVWAVVSLSPIHFFPGLSMVQEVKQETLTQCWTNVGSPSTNLSQQKPSIG